MNAENKIFLIRHCRPEINYSKCNYIEAIKRMHEYNITQKIAIEEILPLMVHIQRLLEMQSLSIFTSSMPRAMITSRALFGERYNIIGDKRFVEFDLNFVQIPLIKLKFGTWALISRVLWFLGMLNTTHSVKTELTRAQNSADFLYQEAQKANVVLVAHGMLNMFIEKRLKKLGYNRSSKVKSGFCSIVTLEFNDNSCVKMFD